MIVEPLELGFAETDAYPRLNPARAAREDGRGKPQARNGDAVGESDRTTDRTDTSEKNLQRHGFAIGEIGEEKLSDEEKQKVKELKKRDRDVREHEMAHIRYGGSLATGVPSYIYERGPDGKAYAVGGEVKIDVKEVPGDPQATIRKMQQIQRAAMAPRDPSPADYRAAAIAAQEESEARIKMARQEAKEARDKKEDPNKVDVFAPSVSFTELYFGSHDAFPGSLVDLQI